MATDVVDLPMPAVEREITTLAGHLAAGTCRFLQLLAAFDAGGGWHGNGMRTCAQWLSWRCGLSTFRGNAPAPSRRTGDSGRGRRRRRTRVRGSTSEFRPRFRGNTDRRRVGRCPRRRGLHAHHRIHWADGGPTTLENLLLTCPHHHLLLHEGGWQLRPRPDRRFDAIAPGGRVLPPSPATTGDTDDLPGTHDADIAPDTVTGTWTGDPLDLAYAVSVFASWRRDPAVGIDR